MKKINLKKEILIVTLIIIAIFAMCSKVLATGTTNSPVQIPVINTTTNTSDTQTQANETTANVVNPTANAIAPTTNTAGSNYEDSKLPQTGDASDYAIFILILISTIVAIYAYRKVREYNIK